MQKKEEILQKLRRQGLKLTPQRMAIIDFLAPSKDHPSAEDIFQGIREKWPMISFSTVYNTLEVLGRIGAVRKLTIIENKVNFDPLTEPHPHLFCEVCNEIKDVHSDIPLDQKEIQGHRIRSCQVYLYGMCSECLESSPKKT